MRILIRNILSVGLVALAGSVTTLAQTTPSAEQMIQQLKPARTRSLRNLAVEVDAPAQASLSLQIQFELNSAIISQESTEALHNLAQALLSPELIGSRFHVEGHTDATGNIGQNLRLSQQRAQAVADTLAAQGVVKDRMVVTGKGSTEPLDSKRPFAAENRRVKITMLN